MSDTGYINDNDHFDNITDLNSPLCTGLGLSCSEFYTARRIISYIATVGNFLIIPFTLYLTFAKMTDGFFKYFTLNLMINFITSAIAALINDLIDVTQLFISVEESKLNLAKIQYWTHFYLKMGNIWFHALALYAVILCYLPYVKPLFFSKNFVQKSQAPYYVVLHTSAILWSTFVTFLYEKSIHLIAHLLTHIILFIGLFVAALVGSRIISRYKTLGIDADNVAKMQQKRLYSFILYSYSIEIITLPVFIKSFVHAICIIAGCEGNFRASNAKNILSFIIYYFYEMRTIIIIIITILAFEPYRRATFSLFCQRSLITNVISITNRKTISNSTVPR